MKTDNLNPYSAHEEILLLLPWLVNKTLNEMETRAVEAHLKVCLVCNRELAALQKLSQAVKQADALESAAHGSFARLQSRIHRPEEPPVKAAPRVVGGQPANLEKPKRKFAFDYSSYTYGAIAAASLILATIPAYLMLDRPFEASYRTLAASEPAAMRSNEVRVVFSDKADSRQKQAAIDSIAGEIVQGPNPMGVYLIRLKQDPKHSTPKEVDDALTVLRKNPQVIFAEPAYSLVDNPEKRNES